VQDISPTIASLFEDCLHGILGVIRSWVHLKLSEDCLQALQISPQDPGHQLLVTEGEHDHCHLVFQT
jgi:hypothetical protein